MSTKIVELIGAAFSLGGRHSGPETAPEHLRQNGLKEKIEGLGIKVVDSGDVQLAAPDKSIETPKTRHIEQVLTFCSDLYGKLSEAYSTGNFPLVLGGDHSISIGTLTAANEALTSRHGPKAKLGVLWVDAHADINTPETTPSGFIHGMPIAALLGMGDERLCSLGGFKPKLKPENIVYIGLRDLDPGERALIRKLGITAFTMTEIDLLGIGEVCTRAYSQLEKNTDGFVLSFDLDVIDPNLAPGVGTPVRGGLTFRESHLVMELGAQAKKLMSVEIVELYPNLDPQKRTTELAINLLESALGRTIL